MNTFIVTVHLNSNEETHFSQKLLNRNRSIKHE